VCVCVHSVPIELEEEPYYQNDEAAFEAEEEEVEEEEEVAPPPKRTKKSQPPLVPTAGRGAAVPERDVAAPPNQWRKAQGTRPKAPAKSHTPPPAEVREALIPVSYRTAHYPQAGVPLRIAQRVNSLVHQGTQDPQGSICPAWRASGAWVGGR